MENFVEILKEYDQDTYDHSCRVSKFAVQIAKEMGLDIDLMERAAINHDIGKRFIPLSILQKPGKLTPVEKDIMDRHAYLGAQYLKKNYFDDDTCDIIRYHHDSVGAVVDLKPELLVYVRILSTCDIFDALTSDRPYRKALSKEEALKIMETERNADAEILLKFKK